MVVEERGLAERDGGGKLELSNQLHGPPLASVKLGSAIVELFSLEALQLTLSTLLSSSESVTEADPVSLDAGSGQALSAAKHFYIGDEDCAASDHNMEHFFREVGATAVTTTMGMRSFPL